MAVLGRTPAYDARCLYGLQLYGTQSGAMQDSEEQAKLGRLACDGTFGVAAAGRNGAERPGATSAAIAAAVTTTRSGNRRSSSRVSALRRLPTVQLVEFCLGAVDHPDNSARLREPSHRALRRLAGQINKVNGEPTWRSRPTVRVRSGSTEFLALMDSGASQTVMRFDTFLKISGSNKEEISGTGIGLTTANDQPLATKGTFLVKLDVEGLGRITHPVFVVEKLAWPFSWVTTL